MTTLYFFAATIFKEVFEKEGDEAKELDEKAQKYGYITIVSLESVENATVLAALTFIDISGALIGALISISTYVALAINSKRFLTRVPLKKLRLIAAILLTITATPLIIYSAAIHTPDWLHCLHHHVSVLICYANMLCLTFGYTAPITTLVCQYAMLNISISFLSLYLPV